MQDPVQSDFLGGRVTAWQPVDGYRAGVDPVLLAASLPARPGQTALELGCGVGVASLCLMARVPGLAVTGLELQPEYADLARRNAADNAVDEASEKASDKASAMAARFEVLTGDLTALPDGLRQQQFDHVFANPPYFLRDRSTAARDAGRDIALGGDTPLEAWVEVAAKRCKPKGYVSFIQRIERLPALMAAMSTCLGSLQVLPLTPRQGRDAQLVLIRGRKNGRADFRLHDGLVLHDGTRHEKDGDDFSEVAANVLRHGAALPFPV